MNYSNSDEGFFVTLMSTLCTEMYSENTSSDFINYVLKPIPMLGDWYMGIVSIDYGDSYEFAGIDENPRYAKKPSTPSNVSNKEVKFLGADNKITVKKREGTNTTFGK
jgi:hypothetical protein